MRLSVVRGLCLGIFVILTPTLVNAQQPAEPLGPSAALVPSIGLGARGDISDLVGPTLHGGLALELPDIGGVHPVLSSSYWLLPLTCTPQDPNDLSECATSGWNLDLGGNVYLTSGRAFRPYLGAGAGLAHAGELFMALNARASADMLSSRRVALRLELRYDRVPESSNPDEVRFSVGMRLRL